LVSQVNGNEKADQAAKCALNLLIIIHYSLPINIFWYHIY